MERILILKALRERREMPSDFLEYSTEPMQKIILWLLDKDPAKRPTAVELLASPLLPSRIHIDDSYIRYF
jgi:translation initiation factor 2-alpha kinase 4